MRRATCALVLGFLLASAQARADGAPSHDAFVHWVHATAGRTEQVRAFETYLRRAGVGGVLLLSQLLLNASSWRACMDAPYSLPPRVLWPNVVPTLRFIRSRIVPALGPVAAVSGYRSPELNACAGGAPQSAHALYYALDLTPLRIGDRDKLIAAVCKLHARFGPAAHVGLGFYRGLRFHIDTHGFRRWGSDYHSGTSPCAALEQKR